MTGALKYFGLVVSGSLYGLVTHTHPHTSPPPTHTHLPTHTHTHTHLPIHTHTQPNPHTPNPPHPHTQTHTHLHTHHTHTHTHTHSPTHTLLNPMAVRSSYSSLYEDGSILGSDAVWSCISPPKLQGIVCSLVGVDDDGSSRRASVTAMLGLQKCTSSAAFRFRLAIRTHKWGAIQRWCPWLLIQLLDTFL